MVTVKNGILKSRLFAKNLPYRIVLPGGYENDAADFPVLYLLHGLFGGCDNWLELTELASHAEKYDLIIVMPEAGNSWYLDSATERSEKFESSFFEELMPEIETAFRIRRRRAGRAIAGLSMGGYGAFKFALKRPDLFVFAASTSGAFDAPLRSDSSPGIGWDELKDSIMRAFGTNGSRTRAENDLFELIGKVNSGEKNDLPFFYFDCGKSDRFLETNRGLAKLLKEKKIAHEYRELSGGHDWIYWNKAVKRILKIADEMLNR